MGNQCNNTCQRLRTDLQRKRNQYLQHENQHNNENRGFLQSFQAKGTSDRRHKVGQGYFSNENGDVKNLQEDLVRNIGQTTEMFQNIPEQYRSRHQHDQMFNSGQYQYENDDSQNCSCQYQQEQIQGSYQNQSYDDYHNQRNFHKKTSSKALELRTPSEKTRSQIVRVNSKKSKISGFKNGENRKSKTPTANQRMVNGCKERSRNNIAYPSMKGTNPQKSEFELSQIVSQKVKSSKTSQNIVSISNRKQRIQFQSGIIYEGQVSSSGKREGYGVQQWPDGAVYVGFWKDNKSNGKGKFTHPDGDYYDGQWKDNKANGKGIYQRMKGGKYEGQWKDDQPDGFGVQEWGDGNIYKGEFAKGYKHGNGRYSWNDGSWYQGQWKNGKIEGKGKYVHADFRSYEGEWLANMMNGHGVYLWKDGRKYIGQYKNDRKHGYGKYFWTDGRVFEGEWVDGKRSGKGVITYPDGMQKFGVWQNDRRVDLDAGSVTTARISSNNNDNNKNNLGKQKDRGPISSTKSLLTAQNPNCQNDRDSLSASSNINGNGNCKKEHNGRTYSNIYHNKTPKKQTNNQNQNHFY